MYAPTAPSTPAYNPYYATAMPMAPMTPMVMPIPMVMTTPMVMPVPMAMQAPPPAPNITINEAPRGPSCHKCGIALRTKTVYVTSWKTHMIALICCLVGCIPCCVLPYCMDSCRDIKIGCINCGALVN